jgi:hypothetical protein
MYRYTEALGLKAELDAARSARDGANAELRGERAARSVAEARAADGRGLSLAHNPPRV